LELIEGDLPNCAKLPVVEWALNHRIEFEENWQRITNGETLKNIEPLN